MHAAVAFRAFISPNYTVCYDSAPAAVLQLSGHSLLLADFGAAGVGTAEHYCDLLAPTSDAVGGVLFRDVDWLLCQLAEKSFPPLHYHGSNVSNRWRAVHALRRGFDPDRCLLALALHCRRSRHCVSAGVVIWEALCVLEWGNIPSLFPLLMRSRIPIPRRVEPACWLPCKVDCQLAVSGNFNL
jgi:hypothetical protein